MKIVYCIALIMVLFGCSSDSTSSENEKKYSIDDFSIYFYQNHDGNNKITGFFSIKENSSLVKEDEIIQISILNSQNELIPISYKYMKKDLYCEYDFFSENSVIIDTLNNQSIIDISFINESLLDIGLYQLRVEMSDDSIITETCYFAGNVEAPAIQSNTMNYYWEFGKLNLNWEENSDFRDIRVKLFNHDFQELCIISINNPFDNDITINHNNLSVIATLFDIETIYWQIESCKSESFDNEVYLCSKYASEIKQIIWEYTEIPPVTYFIKDLKIAKYDYEDNSTSEILGCFSILDEDRYIYEDELVGVTLIDENNISQSLQYTYEVNNDFIELTSMDNENYSYETINRYSKFWFPLEELNTGRYKVQATIEDSIILERDYYFDNTIEPFPLNSNESFSIWENYDLSLCWQNSFSGNNYSIEFFDQHNNQLMKLFPENTNNTFQSINSEIFIELNHLHQVDSLFWRINSEQYLTYNNENYLANVYQTKLLHIDKESINLNTLIPLYRGNSWLYKEQITEANLEIFVQEKVSDYNKVILEINHQNEIEYWKSDSTGFYKASYDVMANSFSDYLYLKYHPDINENEYIFGNYAISISPIEYFTTSAGNFRNCLIYTITESHKSETKLIYIFKPGIGIIKQEVIPSSDQGEEKKIFELITYEI